MLLPPGPQTMNSSDVFSPLATMKLFRMRACLVLALAVPRVGEDSPCAAG